MTNLMYPATARAEIRALSSSLIRDVANGAMGRENVLPFWFGEADRPTAEYIRNAAKESIDRGETFYVQNLGRPSLRNAIADYMTGLHGKRIGPDRIGVVASGVTGLAVAAQLILSPGDRVVAVTPLWPNITEIPRILSADVFRVPLAVREGKWWLDIDRLLDAITPDTKLVIVNSPNNPTGWMIEDEQIQALVAHCRKLGVWILADDVYERLVYDPDLSSAPSFQRHCTAEDRLISVNSFSKAWCMTGWRLGWLTCPEGLGDELAKLIEYNFSSILEPVQHAGIAAQQGEDDIALLRRELVRSRQILTAGLASIPGVDAPAAGGAMYVFFRMQGHNDSVRTAKRLLEEVGLGLAPGRAFGPEGEGWFRWCHATSNDKILIEGIDRLAKFCGIATGPSRPAHEKATEA